MNHILPTSRTNSEFESTEIIARLAEGGIQGRMQQCEVAMGGQVENFIFTRLWLHS
jgi:hypothetical protein